MDPVNPVNPSGDSHFLPLASDEMRQEERAQGSVFARVAAEHIMTTLIQKVRRRFVRNLYRCVEERLQPPPALNPACGTAE